MEKIKTIIIDDDIFIHAQLREQLMLLFPKVQVVAVCENALHGIEAIKSHRPDLIFLDIQMPGLSGFEMLDHVDRNNLKVIFITSYNQYAIEAIRYSAFDYLLKPLDIDELTLVLNRLRSSSPVALDFLEKSINKPQDFKNLRSLVRKKTKPR